VRYRFFNLLFYYKLCSVFIGFSRKIEKNNDFFEKFFQKSLSYHFIAYLCGVFLHNNYYYLKTDSL